MNIYSVSEAYESPMAYFASLESAEAFVAKCAAYRAEWQAWADSPISETESFVSSFGPEADWELSLATELFVDSVTVRD